MKPWEETGTGAGRAFVDALYSIVIVLNTTGLFGFLAPPLGVSIGQISLALLGVNVLYLVSRARDSTAVLLRGGMGTWLLLLLIWPLATVLYAPSLEVRDVGLQLYLFTLFFGATVYTVTNGMAAMHRVLRLSLAITIVGLVLSMLVPGYFAAVAQLAGAAAFAGEVRASGFFLQPNALALNMGFLFIGWTALGRRKNALLEVTAILGILVAMLFTGSRTGVLVVMLVGALTMLSWSRKGLENGRFLLKTTVLLLGLVVGMIGMEYYVSQAETSGTQRDDLIGRVNMLLGLRLSEADSLSGDTSVRERLGAQAVYWQLIRQKPLLGHGLGSETYYVRNGSVLLTAHSSAVSTAMQYGVLYPVVFVLVFLQLYRRCRRHNVRGTSPIEQVGQFVAVTIFLFPISGFSDSRVFYVVLGMFFAMACCPTRSLATTTQRELDCQRRGFLGGVLLWGRDPAGACGDHQAGDGQDAVGKNGGNGE